MLPPITLDSTGLNMAKLPVQPVQFRTIPSSKTSAELEELQKNIENNNINSTSPVTSNNSVSKTKQTEPTVSNAKPERLRFDTYEPSKPAESAGIYEPTVDKNGNRTVSFKSPEQQDSAMLYKLSEQEDAKAASSNLSINTDKGSNLDDRSLLKIASNTRGSNLNDINIPEQTGTGIGFGADKEKTRINMLNNELAQAAQNINSGSKTVFW